MGLVIVRHKVKDFGAWKRTASVSANFRACSHSESVCPASRIGFSSFRTKLPGVESRCPQLAQRRR
jgi:hypothetical protein